MDLKLDNNWTTVFLAFFGVLSAVTTIVATYVQNKRFDQAQRRNDIKSTEVKEALIENQKEVKKSIEQIHILVNGRLTTAFDKYKKGLISLPELQAIISGIVDEKEEIKEVKSSTPESAAPQKT